MTNTKINCHIISRKEKARGIGGKRGVGKKEGWRKGAGKEEEEGWKEGEQETHHLNNK